MPNIRAYERPTSLEDALRRLHENPRAVPLAGGTALVAYGVPAEEATLVDISELPLDDIEAHEDRLVLDALASLETLARHEAVRAFAGGVLAQAAHAEATSLLRQQGRLAGALLVNLAHSELVPALLALDARVTVQHLEGPRVLPLADFYADVAAALGRGLIVRVDVPAPPPGTVARRQRVARAPRDRAILSVACVARVAEGRVDLVRLAASGVGEVPRRLAEVERALRGVPATPEAVQAAAATAVATLSLPDDHRASAEYRRGVLPVLIRRGILGA